MAKADTKASAVKLTVFADDDATLAVAANKSDPEIYSDRVEKQATKSRDGRLAQVAAELTRAGATLSRPAAQATKKTLEDDLQALLLAKLKAELADPRYQGKTDAEAAELLNKARDPLMVNGVQATNPDGSLRWIDFLPRLLSVFVGADGKPIAYAPNAVDAADVAAARAS